LIFLRWLGKTMIDYFASINSAIDFIERHLTDSLSVKDVAQHAFQSRWYFQRIFRMVTGYSVYTYIRNRRLAEAGSELLLTKEKILDIALRYQYATPESFLRAFRKEYDFNPHEYRKSNEHRLFERIDVYGDRFRQRETDTHIRHRLVTRGEIHIIAKRHRTTMQKRQNEADISRFWRLFLSADSAAQIPHRINAAAMGVYTNWDFDENFDVLIGCPVSSLADIPEGFVGYTLPPAKYVVFTVSGNSNADILGAWKYIYGVWMPNTGYERDFTDDFDMFDDRFMRAEKPESEIYIPVRT
jgi:AraC family transcriptional regulator